MAVDCTTTASLLQSKSYQETDNMYPILLLLITAQAIKGQR